MIKINELYIKVYTADNIFQFRDTFDKGLNLITSYSNTKGKSTIGEAILFCLGLEEILGQKNEKAVKPVLRSLIEKDGRQEIVLQSDIYLEIENNKGDIITIQRSPVHNTRKVKLVSVYENTIEDILSKPCCFKDYFVHDGGAAKNIRGFHSFLEKFIGYKLPLVTTYDGSDVPLYMQTIIPGFYIEQKRGWMNIFATMPTYFKIKDSKKRVVEYILGLSVLETEKAYNEAKAKLKSVEMEWKLIYNTILSKVKGSGFIIKGLEGKPFIISEEANLIILKKEDDGLKEVDEVIKEINQKIVDLNNILEPIIENRQEALKRELDELTALFEAYSLKLTDSKREYALEKEQLGSITNRIYSIKKDLEENKDLRKLLNLGSLENTSIAKSNCPTCGQKINGVLFEQDEEVKIMTIDESIEYLNNEKVMLEFAYVSQYDLVKTKEDLSTKLQKRVEAISDRIRIVKSDLISNNKALSQSHIQKIVRLEIDKKEMEAFVEDIRGLFKKMKLTGIEWGKANEAFLKVPSNLINEKDKHILREFEKEFKALLDTFNFESTDIQNISIDEYNYLPSVEGFDLYSDSSASDTIRIIWAYIIALQITSRVYGNNMGFIVLDEPAQQNADISSAKELLKEMVKLSKHQQVFVLYKMERGDNLLDELPKGSFKRIHADSHIIAVATS